MKIPTATQIDISGMIVMKAEPTRSIDRININGGTIAPADLAPFLQIAIGRQIVSIVNRVSRWAIRDNRNDNAKWNDRPILRRPGGSILIRFPSR
jgi:hypothetical protein